jgi:S1-C subfamily serine protease
VQDARSLTTTAPAPLLAPPPRVRKRDSGGPASLFAWMEAQASPFDQPHRLVALSAAITCVTILLLVSVSSWSPTQSEGSLPDPAARTWLGITARDSETLIADRVTGLVPDTMVDGAMLLDVVPGGPADDAQLLGSHYLNRRWDGTLTQAGDVIIAIDGVRIESADALASFITHSAKRVGEPVTIRIVRDGQVFDVLVRLRARDDRQADQVGGI